MHSQQSVRSMYKLKICHNNLFPNQKKKPLQADLLLLNNNNSVLEVILKEDEITHKFLTDTDGKRLKE